MPSSGGARIYSLCVLTLQLSAYADTDDAVIQCEADVFARTYGDTREHLDDFYRGWEGQTHFVSVCDESSGRVMGVARLVTPGPMGLRAMASLREEPWCVDGEAYARAAGLDLETTWDVAGLGVRADRSSAMCTAALYHGLVLTGRVNEVSATVAILDERARELLAGVGIVYRPLPGLTTQPFDSSPASTPAYAPFAQMLATQRRVAPEAYRLVTLGIGLDEVRVQRPEAFLVRPQAMSVPSG